ncbi:hypothetical protein N7527_008721 [Penicillium freii]|nr:hypothetical protein N7527_008721 [Penicillium freii]
MAITAPDSIYRKERSYYLDLLQTQVMRLRTDPRRHFDVADQLRELSRLTPGYIQASLVVGDTVFHRVCCNLQPLFLNAICSLVREHFDPVTGYQIADMLEAAVPAEVRNPYCPPATW